MRFERPCRRERLGARAGGQAALHPCLFAEQHAKAPVDDVVIVDDQHPQAPFHQSDPCSSGTVSRTRQPPVTAGPNSSSPPCWSASNAASRNPIPPSPDACRAPSLRTSSVNTSASRPTATPTREGSACLPTLRSASASTDCASGSRSGGTVTRGGQLISTRELPERRSRS